MIEILQDLYTYLPCRLLLIFIIWTIVRKIEQKIYKKKSNEKRTIKLDFQHACMKLIIATIAIFIALFQFDFIKESASALVTGTSLIVALLGFCFQEAFSNAIHGVVLAMTEPFQVGNRIRLDNGGQIITGYIIGMDMRCVMVRDVTTSSCMMIPNRIMDTSVVENYKEDKENYKSYILSIEVKHNTNIDKAMEYMKEIVENLPQFVDPRTKEEIEKEVPKVSPFVKDLNANGVTLSIKITTKTIEDNFGACSLARKLILEKFQKENIEFATNRIEMCNLQNTNTQSNHTRTIKKTK